MRKFVWIMTLVLFLGATSVYARNARYEIAKNVLRLHIIANSDGEKDQALKLRVRDRILEEYKDELSGNESIEQTRCMIYGNLANIKQTAEKEVALAGYDYTVNVYLAKDYFPTKKYADITLPAGKYEALRVEIGNAQGHNWWCVMFPPLCYADNADSETAVRSKEKLEQVLSGDCYCLITKSTPDVKVKLKIVEIWGEIKEKL